MTVKIAALAALLFASVYSSPCSAIEINDDGFNVDILFNQKSDGLHIWGKVNNGRNCKQLNLTIYMRNGDSAELSRIVTSIRNYRGGPTPYRAIDQVSQESNRKKWFVDNVYTKCLN
ncbi:MAG: hypothetical protein VR65_24865 [Desulfobulbaceae bacterium BRH_c16a]|nr:MAG: hypothetical protein VR65_24865 [Desulfobulbaceae bacterium BRH_c16a]